MDNKTVIIEILQNALSGKLKETINLHHIADALIDKTDFNRSYEDKKNKKLFNLINTAKNTIELFKKEKEDELLTLGENEKLLKNFIRGRIESYEEVIEEIFDKI